MSWKCNKCNSLHTCSTYQCGVCGNYNNDISLLLGFTIEKESTWQCHYCNKSNKTDIVKCSLCNNSRYATHSTFNDRLQPSKYKQNILNICGSVNELNPFVDYSKYRDCNLMYAHYCSKCCKVYYLPKCPYCK
jgi:hypothetical protein